MQWIEGIGRQNGRLMARAVDQSGDRQFVPLADMPAPTKDYAVHRHKISTDFGEWTKATAKEYLAGLDFTTNVAEGHRVFVFTHGGIRYLVPSMILMKAFFRPFQYLSKHLFSPQGLAQASVFKMVDSTPFIHPLGNFKIESNYSRTLQALSWYWSFPSAYECWHSVYGHGAKGQLALDLPTGNMNCVLHGMQKGSAFHVVALTVLGMDAGESPFEFAAGHPRTIQFREKVTKATRPVSHDTQVVKRDGDWTLSDAEWEAVKPLIAQGQRANNTHDMRKIVDLVIEKVGSGTTWRNSGNELISWNATQRHYRKWCVDGRWELIRGALVEMRAC